MTESRIEDTNTSTPSPETDAAQAPEDDAPPAGAEAEPTPKAPAGPKEPIAELVCKMSDRKIQRVVGGNAFLRGRLIARRQTVNGLSAKGHAIRGSIPVKNQDTPFETTVSSGEDGSWISSCTCPGWRGPTQHCKHVAALLVALRDRERPPRPQKKPDEAAAAKSGKKKKKKRGKKEEPSATPVHVPQTVSVGGKRRRTRRRRRGGSQGAEPLEVLSARDLRGTVQERGPFDQWLPAERVDKPYEFDFRLVVRSASLAITPVLAGTRTAVPIAEAIGGFNMLSFRDRPLFRVLSRHVTRGQPATAELRGEDAAEVLNLLRDQRVLLEPSSMELRFAEEKLVPKVEFEVVGDENIRVRIGFFQEDTSRRFSLNNGAWFEGTPGYHLDTTEGIVREVSEHVTPDWLKRIFRTPYLIVALDTLPRLLSEHVPLLAASLQAELPDLGSVADVQDHEPAFSVRADGDIVGARARIFVRYGNQEFEVPPVGMSAPLAFFPPEEAGQPAQVVRRAVGAEMSAVQQLMNLGFTPSENQELLEAEGEDAISFWTTGLGELPEDWDRFIPDDLVGVTIREESVSPQMRVASGVDWLNLDMTFDAGGVAVDELELRACLEQGRRLVRLEDGTYAPVDPESVSEVLVRMAEIYATAGQSKKLPLAQAGRVQDLLALVDGAHATPKAKELFSKMSDLDELKLVAKPRQLKAKLRPYQKAGFSWLAFLHESRTGGILADDMGLGKTLQTIALLVWAKSQASKKKDAGSLLNLVVAPTSVVRNWEREIAKFAPHLKTIVWQGANRHKQRKELDDADVMITSYALIRRDEELMDELNFAYAILDEAQHIKNPLSHTARAAKALKSGRRLALTGTPIENRLSEIWSIMDFVSPGLLGRLKPFEEQYARPIDRGDEEAMERLRATIQPFILRRTKSEVAKDLPDKIEQEMVVPLTDEQQTLYSQILREVRKSVLSEVEDKGISRSQIQILAALTRLRQVACDPRLLGLEEEKWTHAQSCKLGALREILRNAIEGGHRVLIFSQFVSMLSLIRTALDEDGVTYEYLDGSTKDRLEKVDSFNENPDISAFLISLKAGGTGLNLVGADTVIHFDPWWNPAVEDQATDRAHRIGQTKVVNVYRLIARGTVEEKILDLSAKKRTLMTNVLSTEGSPIKGLTRADVDDLFSE